MDLTEHIENEPEVEEYYKKRIGSIKNDPRKLFNSQAKIILHMIPSKFKTTTKCEIGEINRKNITFEPLSAPSGYRGDLFYDKFIILGKQNSALSGCASIGKNGILEAIDANLIEKHTSRYNLKKILHKKYEEYIAILKDLNVDCPIYIYLTFLDVDGAPFGPKLVGLIESYEYSQDELFSERVEEKLKRIKF